MLTLEDLLRVAEKTKRQHRAFLKYLEENDQGLEEHFLIPDIVGGPAVRFMLLDPSGRKFVGVSVCVPFDRTPDDGTRGFETCIIGQDGELSCPEELGYAYGNPLWETPDDVIAKLNRLLNYVSPQDEDTQVEQETQGKDLN